MKVTLKLTSRNEYQSNTSRWLVLDEAGQNVASVLRRNAPFAEYRLIRDGGDVVRFASQAALISSFN